MAEVSDHFALTQVDGGGAAEGTSYEVSLPTAVAGDTVVIFRGIDYAEFTIPLPAIVATGVTFTERQSLDQFAADTDVRIFPATGVVTASAPTFTVDTGDRWAGASVVVFLLPGTWAHVGSGATQAQAAAQNHIAPSVAGAAVGDFLFCAWLNEWDEEGPIIAPGAMAEPVSGTAAGAGAIAGAYQILASAGATGTRTADVDSGTSSARWAAGSVVMRPPAESTAHTRNLVDTLAVTDAATRTHGHGRTAVDALGATDTAARTAAATRPVVDTLGSTDNVGRSQIAARALVDAVGTTDTAARTVESARDAVDTLGLLDTASSATDHGRGLVDPLGLTDEPTAQSTVLIERALVDTLGVLDTAEREHTAERDLTDQLGLADTAERAHAAERQLADTLGVTDETATENVGTPHERDLVDTLGLTDDAERQHDAERQLVDTLGLTDTAERQHTAERDLADTLGVLDAVDAAAAGVDHTRDLVDQLGLADTATRAHSGARALVDQLGLGDVAARGWSTTRALVDTVGVLDSRGVSNGVLVGVPLMPRVLDGARLAVEIAWGADLTADPAGWSWADVTADVRQDPGIATSHGRGDEAATTQPATCTLRLDNSAARYSLGGHSPNWPHVRRGVPVRVRVDPDGAGLVVLFQGYADGFTPSWNLRGTVAEATLSASGTLRRLDQGAPALQSAIRRALTTQPDVVAYWPLEDGKNAAQGAAVRGGDMRYTGRPAFAESDVFDCSAPLPTLAGASLTGEVPPYTPTGAIQLRILLDVPTEGGTNETQLFGLTCTGTAPRWEVRYLTTFGGTAVVRAYDRFGNVLVDQPIGAGLTGFRGQLGLQLAQVGSTVEWDLDLLAVGGGNSVGFGATLTGRTIGGATEVTVNGNGGNDQVTVGHVTVYDAITPEAENADQLNAYAGETPATLGEAGRMWRLARDNAIPLTVLGAPDGTTSPADLMGPQRVATLLQLLREVEHASQAVLYDGHTAGLTLVTRRIKENQPAALVLDAGAGELAPAFAPTDDDQRTRNKVTVTREGGVSATAEDVNGPLGTAVIGTYATSDTVNTALDSTVPLFAGWLLAQGTLEGYRYPSVTVDLLATPQHARAAAALRPGQRVDLVNVPDALPGHPAGSGTVSLIVEGMSHDLGAGTWSLTIACSPYAPWRIALAGADVGDTNPLTMRADTDGSATSSARAAGATTLPVNTPSGPRWTTDADDYPLTLDVGGIAVRATACTSATPQVFTVDPLPIARAAGTPVAVWDPPRLGL